MALTPKSTEEFRKSLLPCLLIFGVFPPLFFLFLWESIDYWHARYPFPLREWEERGEKRVADMRVSFL